MGLHPLLVRYTSNLPGWAAQLLYLSWMFAPAVRCVFGQSVRTALYAEKLYGLRSPALHSFPSGT